MQADQALTGELTWPEQLLIKHENLHLFCTSMPHTRSWRSYTAASASVSSTIMSQSHGKQGPDCTAVRLRWQSLMHIEIHLFPCCVPLSRKHARYAFALWEANLWLLQSCVQHQSLLDSLLLASYMAFDSFAATVDTSSMQGSMEPNTLTKGCKN